MNKQEIKENTDVLIIGAGPSGTVAAAILNKNGYQVKIVEKQKFPRFAIGESLLPRCMHNFAKADFIDVIQGANFQKKYGARFADKYEICDFDFANQFTDGWCWTWQVKRDDFDHLLAREVIKRGVNLDYETEVRHVEFYNDGTSLSTINSKGGISCIKSKFIIDASGYGKVLSRILNLSQPTNIPERSSFFCHVRPKAVSDDIDRKRIIIIVHTDDVWGWIIPFSDGTSSIGLVGSPEGVHQFEGSTEEQMREWINEIPALQERFTGCEILLGPKTISGYASSVKKLYGKGFVLTGNAIGFIDPIFSSGVTLATESAARAAELVSEQLMGKTINWEKEYSEYILGGVNVFKTFIEAWYEGSLQKIFFNANPNEKIKKQICSVLAGYVWDPENPFVAQHHRVLGNLVKVVSR